jgi:hypothetical protein
MRKPQPGDVQVQPCGSPEEAARLAADYGDLLLRRRLAGALRAYPAKVQLSDVRGRHRYACGVYLGPRPGADWATASAAARNMMARLVADRINVRV